MNRKGVLILILFFTVSLGGVIISLLVCDKDSSADLKQEEYAFDLPSGGGGILFRNL